MPKKPPPGMKVAAPTPRPDWQAAADWTRAHPMTWLQVFESGRTALKEAARQGHVNAVHPRLGFEFTSTNNTRGQPRTCTMFMRWNPDRADDVAVVVNNTKRRERS